MKSPERFNPENQDSLWGLREHVDNILGKPNPADAKLLVNQYDHSLRKVIFDALFSDKLRLRKHLTTLKELYPTTPYFRPLICASQINHAKEGVMAEARAAAVFTNQGNQFKFALLFDFAQGMGLVAESVIAAEDNLRNPSKTILSNVVDYWAEHFDLNTVENAEAFLRSKRLFSHFAELLKKDNSGRLLIKEVAKLLKDSKHSKKRGIDILPPPFLVREFVSTGADLGAKLYKKLYPLTSQTTPPKSS